MHWLKVASVYLIYIYSIKVTALCSLNAIFDQATDFPIKMRSNIIDFLSNSKVSSFCFSLIYQASCAL